MLLYSITGASASLDVYVQNQDHKTIKNVSFMCFDLGEEYYEPSGHLHIDNLANGTYQFVVFAELYKDKHFSITITDKNVKLTITLEDNITTQDTVVLQRYRSNRLEDVNTDEIIGSKKNEVTNIEELDASKATNTTRQLFYRSPLTNTIETDGAGIQLGIGGRGLDPHRSSNFNIRQNGYDISADALGYPESYYSPPAEAVQEIEVLRGAASLQYGTQFGGVVNFKLKSGFDKPFSVVSRQTVGSFKLFNSFNSVGGTTKKGVKYYAYYQHKTGDDYRPNAHFSVHNMYGHLELPIGKKVILSVDQTYMTYLSQQPGGLTDDEFYKDPTQSNRTRNWFEVKWYVPSLTLNYFASPKTFISSKFFGLIAERNTVGNLGAITRADDLTSDRNVIQGDFKNVGNETRLIHNYTIKGRNAHLATGFRTYFASNTSTQGYGDNGSDANFDFTDTDNLSSQYTTPNKNHALFLENLFHVGKKFTVTPGVRLEHINTSTEGYYRTRIQDRAGNDIQNYTTQEDLNLPRTFIIAGLGASYKLYDSINTCEIYTNITQNYRSVTFSDIRITNPSLLIDSTIHDEKGYNFDIGIRAEKPGFYDFDVSGFLLHYDDRIGEVQKMVSDPVIGSTTKRFRTNISDAVVYGIELFGQINLIKIFKDSSNTEVNVFVNSALIHAEYIKSNDLTVLGKQIEYAPAVNFKSGLIYKNKKFSGKTQFSYTSEQFSDASNANDHASAVFGIIPAYYIVDLSLAYKVSKIFKIETGINNLTNSSYFTKRASGYPGPGILPASGRNFYLTLQVKL